MSDATAAGALPQHPAKSSLLTVSEHVRRRNAAEGRFRAYGLAAILVSLITLAIMLTTIFTDGIQSFRQASITFPVTLVADTLDKSGNRDVAEMSKVTTIGYSKLIEEQFIRMLAERGIDTLGLSDKEIGALLSREAPAQVRDRVLANPEMLGQTVEMKLLAVGRLDGYLKGRVTMESVKNDSIINPTQLQLAENLRAAGILTAAFNWTFITGPMPPTSGRRPPAWGWR